MIDADDLIAADGKPGLADRGPGGALGLGRDIEGDEHDDADGEHERAEDQPGELVGARLVERELVGDRFGTATFGGLRGLARATAAAANMRGGHASASAIRRSTSSP